MESKIISDTVNIGNNIYFLYLPKGSAQTELVTMVQLNNVKIEGDR